MSRNDTPAGKMIEIAKIDKSTLTAKTGATQSADGQPVEGHITGTDR